jgi:hypothetical protein
MSPQLIQIAECLNEANTREIKIARCLAESLKRIQELEQSKTEASQQAKEAEKRFSAALHDLAEQLTKTGEETTSIAQHLSNQINTEKEQFSAELSNVVDQLTKTSEQAKVEFGYKVDEIALKLAELPAQMAAFKAEFATPAVQADAPKSFNPRGAYENGEKYQPFDYVSANGSSYIALVENPTEPPSKRSKQWMLVAARGASGSGGIISASEVVGLGTAATRDVGQAAGNVLELSNYGEISIGDGGGADGVINIYDNVLEAYSAVRSVDGQLTIDGNPIAVKSELTNLQSKAEVKSANFTAANDGVYTITASATVTDPSPNEGKGFVVFVRNGTATVGGTAYSVAGTVIRRVFHSGAWANYEYASGSGGGGVPTSRTLTTTAPLTIDGTTSADLSANRTLAVSAATTTTAGTVPTLGATGSTVTGAPTRRQLLVAITNQFAYRILGAMYTSAASSGTGTASASDVYGNIRLTGTTSAGARDIVPPGSPVWGVWNGNFNVVDWGQSLVASGFMDVYHTGTPANDTRIRCGVGKASAAIGQIANRGFMVEIQWNGTNYEVFCGVHNGTTLNLQTTGITFATSRGVLWSLEADGAGNAQWYVSAGGSAAPYNGQARTTITLSQTGAPTGTEASNRYAFIEINNGAAGGAALTVDFQPMSYAFGI